LKSGEVPPAAALLIIRQGELQRRALADEVFGHFLTAHPQFIAGKAQVQKQAVRLHARIFFIRSIDRTGVAKAEA